MRDWNGSSLIVWCLESFPIVSEVHGIHSPTGNEENMIDAGTTVGPTQAGNTLGMSSYANVTGKPSGTKVNFRTLFTPRGNEIDVVVPVESIRAIKDVGTVPVWVKLHGVPVTVFSEDGLSDITSKLGTPLMFDSYTSDMCMQSWAREGYYTCNIRVEYEWKPPRCACCKVSGHVQEECPKNIGAVYQPVSKKPTANTSKNKKKNMEPTKEVSKSNPFEVLTSVDNDVELGTNGGTSNLASQETNSSGSSLWNVDSSSPSTTPIIEKIDKIEKLIIDGKVTLVASVDNEMASFLTKKDRHGTQSLLERWKESYENDDYEYDLYGDDMSTIVKVINSVKRDVTA
ncbi:DNA helicase [Tanacetum coccineum]